MTAASCGKPATCSAAWAISCLPWLSQGSHQVSASLQAMLASRQHSQLLCPVLTEVALNSMYPSAPAATPL